jgi:hypothetical protein
MKFTLLAAFLAMSFAGCSAAFAQATTRASAPATASAEEQNPYLWKPRTTSVSVFKNGMGFFMREGEVALRDGWAVTEEVPPASFGTLAIYSHAADELVDMVGSGPGEVVEFDGKDAAADSASKRARLESCKNLKLLLTYSQKGVDRTASGKLVSIGPEFAVLEKDSSSFAVPVDGVSKLQVLELPIRVHVASDGGKAPTKTKLGMAYLRKGVTWIPEYTLRVLDEENAELTLRGTFVNEAEDLVHADVNFVVGVPNFMHSEYLEPISIGQVIRTIGAAVAPAAIQTQITNRAAFANDIGNGIAGLGTPDVIDRTVGGPGRDVGSVLGNLPKLDAAAGSDFTVYTRKDVTLRRGEKAIVTLFVKKIKYAHLYRWNLPSQMKHFLVLGNGTDTAWTTGPILAMSNGQPLSEDILTYTPRDGRAEIPVTASINIAQEQSEQESARKLKDYSPNNRDAFLDLVTLSGKLTVKNFEKRPVDIVVSINVIGKPTEASDDGVLVMDTQNLMLRERTGSIKWTIKVPPGQTKVLTYKYERYVPSN